MSLIINGQNKEYIELKKGEVKRFTFRYSLDISSTVFHLGIKENYSDTQYKLEVQNADFDRTEIDDNKIKAIIDTSDLDKDTIYIMEIKATWSDPTLVDKTEDIKIKILNTL